MEKLRKRRVVMEGCAEGGVQCGEGVQSWARCGDGVQWVRCGDVVQWVWWVNRVQWVCGAVVQSGAALWVEKFHAGQT